MTKPHSTRDKLGPMFESVAIENGYPIEHGDCDCGATCCAYRNRATGYAFSGFVLAFQFLESKNAIFITQEHLLIQERPL